MNALILGVGNVLMMDEGVGVRAVEEIEKRYLLPDEVEVLDGGTSGIDLLPYIAGKDLLIIVDSIKSGHPPGTVVRVEKGDVPRRFMTKISPHQIGIADLLATATLTGELPEGIVLFGIEPAKIETGLGLSPEVKAGLDKLIHVIIDELKAAGFNIEPLANVAVSKSRWEV